MMSRKIITLTIMKGITIMTGMIEIIIKGMMAVDMGDEMTTINEVGDFKVEDDMSEIEKPYHIVPSSSTHD